MSDLATLGSVLSERIRAREKWGDEHDDTHTPDEWEWLIIERAGLFRAASLRKDRTTMRMRLVETVVIAMSAIDALERTNELEAHRDFPGN